MEVKNRYQMKKGKISQVVPEGDFSLLKGISLILNFYYRARRVCVHCKGDIKGAQWEYIKCRGQSCKNGMSHFKCLGFPGGIQWIFIKELDINFDL